MVIAQAHFAGGEHHRLGFLAADFAHFEGDAGAGDEGAGEGGHADQAGARIGRAADHGVFTAIADIHAQRAQTVGIGVLAGLDHPGDDKAGQGGGAVFHAFNLDADAGEGFAKRCRIGREIEMGAQPGEREFHVTRPHAGRRGSVGSTRNGRASGYRPHRRGAGRRYRA